MILGAQSPRSDAHDEMLFIIQHQTSELWMRLALHELNSARDGLNRGEFRQAFKMLTRVARIFDQLNGAWDVLRTMTPSEYTKFRTELGASSGFQSHQYRLIEYILGNRNRAMMKVHEHRPELHAMLSQELRTPSLYHAALHALEKELGLTFDEKEAARPHGERGQRHQPPIAIGQAPEPAVGQSCDKPLGGLGRGMLAA